MTAALIAINRLDKGIYEWRLVYGSVEYQHEGGLSSINDCLQDGIGCVPGSDHLVEISYEGVHMGSFHRTRVEKNSAAVATEVNDEYAFLANPSY